jgi:hypothetical protein
VRCRAVYPVLSTNQLSGQSGPANQAPPVTTSLLMSRGTLSCPFFKNASAASARHVLCRTETVTHVCTAVVKR